MVHLRRKSGCQRVTVMKCDPARLEGAMGIQKDYKLISALLCSVAFPSADIGRVPHLTGDSPCPAPLRPSRMASVRCSWCLLFLFPLSHFVRSRRPAMIWG